MFKDWQRNINDLAKCLNVHIKLGGMGMHFFGFEFEKQTMPPSAEELANAWRPFVETCVAAFGPQRAMFKVISRSTSVITATASCGMPSKDLPKD